MFPPQYSRVFEIAGMPADRARSGAQLKGGHKEKGGKLMFPVRDGKFGSFNNPQAAMGNSKQQQQKHGARCSVAE